MPSKISLKKIALTVSVFFMIQTSFCQKNYLPGFIIRESGDTLHGFIDYNNWERNPDKISFKITLSDNHSNYTPMDIKGFGVLDEFYASAIVETEESPFITKDLLQDAGLQIKVDTAFLQAMVNGIKSLYYYKNKTGNDQFYIRQDSSYVLLIYKKYLKEQQDQTVIVENKKFIGQLTIYFNDCPKIHQKLQSAEYRKNSLENLFLSYYNCTNSPIIFHKKTEKVAVEFGVLAGVSMTALKFSGDIAYITDAGYQPSVNFSGGLFLEVILSRNRGKWSINNELMFTSYNVNGRVDEYVNANTYTMTYTSFGYSYLKMNNMLRYRYPVGKLFLFLNAGISNGFVIAEKNYKKEKSVFYTQERIEEGKALDAIRRYELGFVVGLGVKFKKISLELRYENGDGMSDYVSLKSSTTRFHGLVGYRF